MGRNLHVFLVIIVEFKCLLLMYKVRHSLLSPTLQNHFNKIGHIHLLDHHARELFIVSMQEQHFKHVE